MTQSEMTSAILKPRQSRKFSVFGSIVVFLAALLVCGGLAAFKYFQFARMSNQGPPPEMATAVDLVVAQPIQFRSQSTAVGTVVAPQSIILSNEVPGTVARVSLQSGSIVEPGTVLVELDSSVEQAQLTSATAAVQMARSRYHRVKEAQRNGALTELELEEAESQLVQSEARVAELTAIIKRKSLVAPFRARVGISDTHVGQYLPSGTNITSLQGVDDFVYVDFSLPQQVVETIQVGAQVAVYVDNQPKTGRVLALDSRADRLSRNLLVRARLDDITNQVKPGSSLAVEVEYGPEMSGVILPSSAVRRTPTGTQVFVAQQASDGQLRASRRVVQIQSSLGDQTIVAAGIAPGDHVVTTGAFKLSDGGLLMQPNAKTASTDQQASLQ